jgi:hypothetical protein
LRLLRHVNSMLLSLLSDMSEGLPSLLALIAINSILFADIIALIAFMKAKQVSEQVEYFQRDHNIVALLDGFLIGYMLSSMGWYTMGYKDGKRWLAEATAKPTPPDSDYVI